VRVKAKDTYDEESGWSIAFSATITSNPPNAPTQPSGPAAGLTNNSYNYSASATDSDGDQVYYWFDWDDGSNSGWLGPYNSGQAASAGHAWADPGTYNVTVKAKDEYDEESGWSTSYSVDMTSQTPAVPSEPAGPASGYTDSSYGYTTSATEPDGDELYYWFDWDDGTNSGWLGPYASGQVCNASHSWSNPGSYSVKAKAKDEWDEETAWSDSLLVTLIDILYVDDDNTSGPWDGTQLNPYQTIQDGVNAISDNGEVYVLNGIYYEEVAVEHPLNLTGESKDNTVINGMGTGIGIYVFGADSVSISGFQVKNISIVQFAESSTHRIPQIV